MVWIMSRHGRWKGDIVKAYAKGQAWRASVRDTRHNEVVVMKRQQVKKQKKQKKDPLLQFTFFFGQKLGL